MALRLTSMTAGLAAGITAAVAVACAAGAYLYSTHHFRTLIESEKQMALAQGEMLRAALEHQMMENDRSLIAQLVASFAREPRVAQVVLLDRSGVARFASGALPDAHELDLGSPTCQACHRLSPERRAASQVIETGDATILRTMVPFRNSPPCHRCHDPTHRINGVMLFDVDAGGIRAELNRDMRYLVAGTGAVALLLVLLIALVVRLVVLRRLQRFETTARLIAAGDLAQRIPAEGTDTVSWLAREFNTMADSVTGLLGTVRAERERLEIVINSIDDGIVVLDPQRRIVAANDAFLRRSGSVREETLGCSCRDLTPSPCSGDCPTLACLGSGQHQVRLSERRKPDGSLAWEEVHASPIRGPQGELLQVVEVWRDITERRASEARLADGHRLASLGQLASGFSHEMNTPLATVLACVEGMLREARARPEDPEWAAINQSAAIAREQLLRCRGVTQHFLRLARGQSSADIVDLAESVRAVARLVEPTAREHGVRIELGPLPSGLHVRADESALQHTLVNLVLNAVQACRPGGRVALAAEQDRLIRLRVSDDGCGIAADERARIFEPFVSLRRGGTGLGLFLSLSFVRRWGGEIVVDSVPGSGSTFELRLPAAASVAGAAQA